MERAEALAVRLGCYQPNFGGNLFSQSLKTPSNCVIRVAGLGGLVTILALALEPTTQQVIVFQDRNIASTTANSSMPFAIEPANDGSGVELAAIKGVIADDVSELTRNIAVDCPGGNCTFAPFESLAMCSRCQDITAEVQAL